jgi:hypothetical protein
MSPNVAGSGIGVVKTEPDQVFEKIPVGELAAAATAAIVVALNWPEIASVNAADARTWEVSETIPLTVIDTVTLSPIWDRTKPPTQS